MHETTSVRFGTLQTLRLLTVLDIVFPGPRVDLKCKYSKVGDATDVNIWQRDNARDWPDRTTLFQILFKIS